MSTDSDSVEMPIRSESRETSQSSSGHVVNEQAAEPTFITGPLSSSLERPRGPGLWEALLWMAAFFVIEIAGSIAWYLAISLFHLLTTGQAPSQIAIQTSVESVLAWMIGSIKLVEVVVILLAIRLRFGPRAFDALGFRKVPAVHGVILAVAVVPTAFLAGQSYALLHGYWEQIAENAPLLKAVDELSSIETVQEMAKTTPLAALVLIIAVFPALNEEFLFRAAIGTGLLARYGLIAGIALTSMLFAAMHLSPTHAAALIPLAVLIHVAYLSTGSIWSSVGIHFLNNALSVVLMKWATVAPEVGGIATDVTETSFSPLLFLSSAACVAATVWLLFKMRVAWKLPNGELWNASPLSVDVPPRELDATLNVPIPPKATIVTAAVCYVIFPLAFAVSLWLHKA